MMLILLEHIERRRFYHFRAFCQDHRLKHVDHLGYIGHLYAFTVFIENIKGGINCGTIVKP